ncbi:hypothetical protein D1007_19765 [Hordeum vulgare]|nr:hypothetical protein D1007_19765 [Hordeum vulgare]
MGEREEEHRATCNYSMQRRTRRAGAGRDGCVHARAGDYKRGRHVRGSGRAFFARAPMPARTKEAAGERTHPEAWGSCRWLRAAGSQALGLRTGARVRVSG